MRTMVGIFGAIGAAVVVMLAAIYGFSTSDTPITGAVVAFFFAIIALGAIGGPAAAVHLSGRLKGWSRLWAGPAALIVVCAILGNLSNTLGALVGRADRTLAERTLAKDSRADDRAALERIGAERSAMRFTPATAEAVEAARQAVAAAERTRIAECGNGDPRQRGSNCRAREVTEQEARDVLVRVAANKAAMEKAAKLDADAALIRTRLEAAPPVASVNPLAEALARILHMPAADTMTWRDFFLVAVAELLIAGALAAFEALRPVAREADIVEPTPARRPDSAPPRKPQLIATSAGPPVGSVPDLMTDLLEPSPGAEVEIEAAYHAYAAACRAQNKRAVDPDGFMRSMKELCRRCSITTKTRRTKIFLVDVGLARRPPTGVLALSHSETA